MGSDKVGLTADGQIRCTVAQRHPGSVRSEEASQFREPTGRPSVAAGRNAAIWIQVMAKNNHGGSSLCDRPCGISCNGCTH